MKTSQRVAPGRAAALAVGLVALPAVMAAGHPGQPHATKPPKAPALAVSVSDGRDTARAGDKLAYTVTVRDTGTAPVHQLKVTQTLSAGLTFLSASDHGTAKGAGVTWTIDLPADGSRTFHVAAQVTKAPSTTLRLAAVACATLPGSSHPAVCAAHLDKLPAAAAAPAARPGGSGVSAGVYVLAGVAALALVLFAALTGRGRLRRRRQDDTAAARPVPRPAPRSGRNLAAPVPQRVTPHDQQQDEDQRPE